ncbi:MAG: cytochrome c maturation protein CcmE [Bacteroidetes bacterium]|nr:cytochrome c maturation protein CcmE [Bacteroidota bacterium]
MKRSHLVLLLLVASMMGMFISFITSTSRSVGFETAFADPGVEYKVSGTLVAAHPVEYDAQVNTNLTKFHLQDKQGDIREVWLQQSKPTGLERSESIDLYGYATAEGHFHATDMLMKCPSKYNEQNHLLETDV